MGLGHCVHTVRQGRRVYREACRRMGLLEQLEPRLLMSTLVDLLGNHGGGLNTGQNLNEPILTTSNVNSTSFGKLYSTTLDGQVYAEILEVHNVNITIGTAANQGLHDVLFAATMHDGLYAVDAETGTILWQDSFLNIVSPQVTGNASFAATAGVTTVPVKSGDNALIGTVLGPELGILSTPVIDAATGIIYLETNTQEFRTFNGTSPVASYTTGNTTDIHYVQRLWALNISNGSVAIAPTNNPSATLEPPTGGQIIGDVILDPTGTNTVPSFTSYTGYKYVAGPFIKGTGDNGDFVSGTGDNAPEDGWAVNPLDTTTPWGAQGKTPMQTGYIAFNAIIEMNRVALTEINGTIYVGFASHGDDGPYYGFLLGFSATTLANTQAFVTAPSFEDFATVSGDKTQFDSQAGLWSAGGSITTDGTYIYFTTGNGAFDPYSDNFSATYTTVVSGPSGNHTVQLPLDNDYGNSVLKIVADPLATQANINVAGGVFTNPNGSFDPDGGYNANGYGLKVVDYFTASNALSLNFLDEDLNAGAVLLLPNTVTSNVPGHVGDPMLVAAGKEGRIYLIDQDNMGGFNFSYPSAVDGSGNPVVGPDPSTFDRVLGEYYYYQTLHPGTTSGNETFRAYSSPSYNNGNLYIGLSGAPEMGFSIASFPTGTTPPGSGVAPSPNFKTSTTFGGSGDTATITGNGANGTILWNVNVGNASTDTLVAFNIASTGTVSPLFTSPTTGANSLTGGVTNATGVKFTVPTVANGIVYAGTGGGTGTGGHIQGTIAAFGLLTPALHAPVITTSSTGTPGVVHLVWSRTSGDQESDNIVQRSLDGTSWTTIALVGNGTTSYDDSTVASNTHYFYRVGEQYGKAAIQNSASVQVTTPGLILNSTVSRKNEGTGTLDITLFSVGTPVVEPREGGPTQLVFTFNENVTLPGNFSLGLTSGTGTAVASGNTVTVNLSGATNLQTLTITLTNVADPTNTLSSYSTQVEPVVGDTDGNAQVNIADLQAVANNWQQPVSGPAQGDFNGDGVVDIRDLQTVANNWQAGVGAGGGSGSGSGSAGSETENLAPAVVSSSGSAAKPLYVQPTTAKNVVGSDGDADLVKRRGSRKARVVWAMPRI